MKRGGGGGTRKNSGSRTEQVNSGTTGRSGNGGHFNNAEQTRHVNTDGLATGESLDSATLPSPTSEDSTNTSTDILGGDATGETSGDVGGGGGMDDSANNEM